MPLHRTLAIAALACLALAACGRNSAEVQTAGGAPLGEQVRAYLLEHPEVIEEAITKLQQKRQVAADAQLRQALADNREAMERDPRDYVAGNPQGAITVVQFFDYRCPYCKASLPEVEKLLEENKDVRLVLKEFPILSPASEAAARAAIGAKAQGKYWEVHKALLAERNLDDASIERVLRENGVDVARARRDGSTPQADAILEETRNLARAARVTGTPAYIIGDRMVSGWVRSDVVAGIEAARQQAALAPSDQSRQG